MAKEFGVAGNGRAGRWYVEIEEEIDTEQKTLIVELPNVDFQIVLTGEQDLRDLISALEQARQDAFA